MANPPKGTPIRTKVTTGNPGTAMPPTPNKSAPAPVVGRPSWVKTATIWIAVIACGFLAMLGIETLNKQGNSKQVATENTAALPQGIVCPDGRADAARICTVTRNWSEKFTADDSVAKGMLLCHTPGVEIQRTEEHGGTFWRFRTIGGSAKTVSYRFFNETVCPEKMPS